MRHNPYYIPKADELKMAERDNLKAMMDGTYRASLVIVTKNILG